MLKQERSPFDNSKDEGNRLLGNTLVQALSAKGYSAQYVATREEALEKVLTLVPEGASVGIPGSVTIREIGALESLKQRGNTVFHHWDPSLTPEDKPERLRNENDADVFLTSTNALTQDGMFVNIDGVGNRVSAMAWGAGRLIFVVGINKVVRDLPSAIQRVRDKATPPNVIRLNIETPCSKTGHCMNCNVPERVCRALLILERATMGRDIHVIIVGESLGY
ncbi:MAG TPA: lactate utilization protein [Synergistales bacterium]|nr:lactate utilization protein [Synergistales bacterium]